MVTAAASSPLEVPVAAVRVTVRAKWCKGLAVVDVLVVRLALVVLVGLRLAVLLRCWLWTMLFARRRNSVDNLGAA